MTADAEQQGQYEGKLLRDARLRRGGVTPAGALPTEADCGHQWDVQHLTKKFGSVNRSSYVDACTTGVRLAQLKPDGTIAEVD
ncbi:hypothetical protein [Streptomyces sp. NBC_01465]|uniref:hypothetical protein n=1 Tax=Streptomyces sp. NBC_01465 TaxID=2903878 RepID=UPI002E3694D4|nr:hypothetical protein [Streptomyces sp. NBC_01465]